MSFSPVIASEQITGKYKRYLKTIFSINDEHLSGQFDILLDEPGLFAKGPYLEVNDSFEKGMSIDQLIGEGLLSKSFKGVNIPHSRALYKHQEIAVKRILSDNNVVVSTGTGSGKTECFLIPLLNTIIREHENGKLNDGVRGLLIYPMNALANDQIERLRKLLADYPEITYGSYTGQTKHKHKDALAEYRALNNNEEPLKNELISREQIKETPPHILITNYAMLEYLMIRPEDNVFFCQEHADKWKYIVLDEAHVYHGGSGIEVSMLLRRLKARLQNDGIRYLLTSATLGSDDSNAEVAMFAENLCGSKFDASDVIRAYRIVPKANRSLSELPAALYSTIAELIDHGKDEDEAVAKIKQVTQIKQTLRLSELLYDLLLHDNNYHLIKAELSRPTTLIGLSNKIGWSVEQIADFVTVASKAEKNEDRLFDARYHMFLRATESVFATLGVNKKLFLTRKKLHYEPDGTEYHVFEIATCSICHSIYIIGKEENNHLEQSSFNNADDLKSVFFLGESASDTDDDYLLEETGIEIEEYEVCSRCGYLRRGGSLGLDGCEHGKEYFVKLIKMKLKQETKVLTKCISCENTNTSGILRMFFTGQEAVTSVIGTALFEALPSYTVTVQTIGTEDDDSGFKSVGQVVSEERVKQTKQFIAFSDSRQAAAFYATYLDQTYRTILYKRLIYETLSESKMHMTGKSVDLFVDDLSAMFEKYEIASENIDISRREAWKAILHELVDNNGNTSLTKMGLIGISVNPTGIPSNEKYGLTADDVQGVCSIFALGMMTDAAIYYNTIISRADKEFFTHNGVEYSYTLSDPNLRSYRRAFIPRFSSRTNKRTDYLRKVLEKNGYKLEQEAINKLLEAIWERIFIPCGLVKVHDGTYKLNSEKIKVSLPQQWYVCPVCKRVSFINIKGVCPSYLCEGELVDVDLSESMKENHYYQIYKTLDIRELNVVEHTAQLNRERAYEYQKQFVQKSIDVLSCSTTFEMGVDVGTLETVFMRNMPPSPANYAQRAGRAGRSKNTAAYALTFCNKSSHDFTYFSMPLNMIKGRIDPPRFVPENEKIAIRHVYASALSFFWKANPSYFSTVSKMTEAGAESEAGVQAFKRFLLSHPHELKTFIGRFLPDALCRKFSVETFGWLDGLISDDNEDPGVLTKAIAEYEYEVGILKQAVDDAIKAETRVDYLRARVRVYQNEDILSFLSRKNVLPKYGFPVDTVEMTVAGKNELGKLGLQLQRDLAMAISEYAPGSQIVANGNLITSRYIRKVPRMSWKMYDYIICAQCNTLNLTTHIGNESPKELTNCRGCKQDMQMTSKRVFLIPKFGFEADGNKITKPGLRRPERTYRGDVSYVGSREDVIFDRFNVGSGEIEVMLSSADEMAVLNHSNFFVCETCGYTNMDEKAFTRVKREKHKNSAGYWCINDGTNTLKRYSLGYRFETDVLLIRFLNPDITEWNTALSVLYGILRGTCRCLNIEESDVSGCVQYFYNDLTNRANFSLVLYDVTPGGAGHVKRLSDKGVLDEVLKETQRLMEKCSCGGEDKDSSCYSCLRSYYNQKQHDIISRKYVIDLVGRIVLG